MKKTNKKFVESLKRFLGVLNVPEPLILIIDDEGVYSIDQQKLGVESLEHMIKCRTIINLSESAPSIEVSGNDAKEVETVAKSILKDFSKTAQKDNKDSILLDTHLDIKYFLSFRYSELGTGYAREIMKFLELQGIKGVTAEKFEPRSISSQVSELLNSEIDFLILIVAEDGESMWTRDEIATMRAKGKPIIVLVSEASTFEQGIFGDLESIRFSPGHIGDTYNKLLEGIEFIKKM